MNILFQRTWRQPFWMPGFKLYLCYCNSVYITLQCTPNVSRSLFSQSHEDRHGSPTRASYGYPSWARNLAEVCYLNGCTACNIVSYCTAFYKGSIVLLYICASIRASYACLLWVRNLVEVCYFHKYCTMRNIVLRRELSGVRTTTVCTCIY